MTVLPLSNLLPGNKSVAFICIDSEKVALPSSHSACSQDLLDPESRWLQLTSSEMVFITSQLYLSQLYLLFRIQISATSSFLHLTSPRYNFFSTSYPITESEFGHTGHNYSLLSKFHFPQSANGSPYCNKINGDTIKTHRYGPIHTQWSFSVASLTFLCGPGGEHAIAWLLGGTSCIGLG